MKMMLKIIFVLISIVQNSKFSFKNEEIRQKIIESFKDKPIKLKFKIYHTLYNKKYDLYSEEGIYRYKNFKNSLKQIEEVNKRDMSYKLSLNEFSDMTNEEFKEMFSLRLDISELDQLIKNTYTSEEKDNRIFVHNQFLKEVDSWKNSLQTLKVDWTNYLFPALHQGNCGSCWAFASIVAIEGNYNIHFGKNYDLMFSPKELVDCSNRNDACYGGYPNNAMDYIKKYGISSMKQYPYIFFDTSLKKYDCYASLKQRYFPLDSYSIVSGSALTDSVYYDMLKKGPIVVFVDSDARDSINNTITPFKNYKTGVIENVTCKSLNHVVVVTGIDYDDKGQFLIARNSWGSTWGEEGNFKIRINSSNKTCFMTSSAILPIVRNINDSPPIVPGCMKVYSQAYNQGIVSEICGNSITGPNFPIYSIDIGKNFNVKFYSQPKCKGTFKTLTNSSLSTYILAQSIESVGDGESKPYLSVWVYSDYCYTGERLDILRDNPDLNLSSFGNKISSIKFGLRIKSASVYDSPNYTGSSQTLYPADGISLFQNLLDKKIQSIKLNF